MAQLFCSNCGKKILYETTRPNSCGYCGKSLNAGFNPTPPNKIKPRINNNRYIEPEEEEDPDNNNISSNFDPFSMGGLDVVIVAERQKGESVKSLAFAEKSPSSNINNLKLNNNRPGRKRTKPLEVTAANLPQDFVKEAGLGRTAIPEPTITDIE